MNWSNPIEKVILSAGIFFIWVLKIVTFLSLLQIKHTRRVYSADVRLWCTVKLTNCEYSNRRCSFAYMAEDNSRRAFGLQPNQNCNLPARHCHWLVISMLSLKVNTLSGLLKFILILSLYLNYACDKPLRLFQWWYISNMKLRTCDHRWIAPYRKSVLKKSFIFFLLPGSGRTWRVSPLRWSWRWLSWTCWTSPGSYLYSSNHSSKTTHSEMSTALWEFFTR